MKKVAVLVDSGSQIEFGKYEKEGLFVVPLSITMNDKTYLDQIDINTIDLFKDMLTHNTLVMTSQPSTGELIKIIQRIKEQGYNHILGIVIATGLSSTINGMKLAADMEDISIDIVDSKSTAFIQKQLAFKAIELLKQNKPVEDIITILNQMVKASGTIIFTPNLDHLKRGGRITPAVALLAGMLKIVPVMELNQEIGGKIDSLAKVRTISKAMHIVVKRLLERGVNNKDYKVIVEHVLSDDYAIKLKQLIEEELLIKDIEIRELPAVVGAHMGIGGIGVQYIKIKEV